MSRNPRALAYGAALVIANVGALVVSTVLAPGGAGANPKPPGHGGGTGSPTQAVTSATAGFTNFSVSNVTGVTCPGGTPCTNGAAEPAIRSDNAGTFYASSENGLGGGTIAVKSTDGGNHYTTLASPNAVSSSNTTGFAPGGGDTDLATAPALNPLTGKYNVYVASLNLANVDVSTSVDGGNTWTLNPVSATMPVDDREWIAADGPSKVCISYHDAATTNINVDCSADAGTTFGLPSSAIDATHSYLVGNNEIGNLTIDPTSHTVYQIFSGIGRATDSSPTGTSGYHAVWIGVSNDGGTTFTDYPVYINPNAATDYGHQFVNVSLDKAGNLYAVYSDNHNLYYSFSTTHGQTWSAPVQVNQGPSATAIMPWSVAGNAGHLDVVWYGTGFYDGKTTPDNYPNTAAWNVYFAQNLNAITPGSGFTQVTASPVNHYGGVCESGVTCSGNRDLYDDFGVAANPLTGLASIVYSDDQYSSTDPNSSGCTPSTSNSSSCDHTEIATQTTGSGI